jgi:hypothetical protein
VTRELVPPHYPQPVRDVVATAVGASPRSDPVQGRTGGPAGNARFTAWLGIFLLVLFAAEGVTLLSVHHLISAHIVIGTVLVPIALLKTATTGWRILRYYFGDPAYRQAGPPPLVLRLLGPLVVLTALAVLGSGLALVALGQDATYRPLVSVGPWSVNALTIHQASFAAWFVVTALHVLARTIPALQLAAGRRRHGPPVRGTAMRALAVGLSIAVGIGAGVAVLHASTSWTAQQGFFGHDDGG